MHDISRWPLCWSSENRAQERIELNEHPGPTSPFTMSILAAILGPFQLANICTGLPIWSLHTKLQPRSTAQPCFVWSTSLHCDTHLTLTPRSPQKPKRYQWVTLMFILMHLSPNSRYKIRKSEAKKKKVWSLSIRKGTVYTSTVGGQYKSLPDSPWRQRTA